MDATQHLGPLTKRPAARVLAAWFEPSIKHAYKSAAGRLRAF